MTDCDSKYRTGSISKDDEAMDIVFGYIQDHLDKSDGDVCFEVYTVWKSKILRNWKYLISSTLYDGMYYELTYNGETGEWYLDAYKKFENRVIDTSRSEWLKKSLSALYTKPREE